MGAHPVAHPLARPNEVSFGVLCGSIFLCFSGVGKGCSILPEWRSTALTNSALSPDCPTGASVCPCRHRQMHGLREGLYYGLLAAGVGCLASRKQLAPAAFLLRGS